MMKKNDVTDVKIGGTIKGTKAIDTAVAEGITYAATVPEEEPLKKPNAPVIVPNDDPTAAPMCEHDEGMDIAEYMVLVDKAMAAAYEKALAVLKERAGVK